MESSKQYFVEKGQQLLASQNMLEALEAFSEGLKVYENDPELILNKAQVFREMGSFTEAIELSYEAMKHFNEDSDGKYKCLMNIGMCHFI